MPGLNLKNLKDYRDEILKIEIVSLLALWGKMNPDKLNKANIILHGLKSLSDWENVLKNKTVKILTENFDLWNDFLRSWREWRSRRNKNYLLQVLYGIGESLNSGIDKGSPSGDVKIKPEYERWIANPFGSFKKKIIYLQWDETCINNKFSEIKQSIDGLLGSGNISWEDVTNIKEKIEKIFSGLLSDDRFPANEISLWDQVYMATTMFKASLAEYVLNNDIVQDLPKRNEIKWRILGIQYDKLGLSERGYKPAQIQWYRETAKEIDEEVKKLMEYDYPIGNEIYRDETGIYFLIGEKLGEDIPEDNIGQLNPDLSEIYERILCIFKHKSLDEFYPAIFVTKASRGLVNLGYLVEKARENFLKADWRKKNIEICIENSKTGKAVGICQLCGQRMVFESNRKDESKYICKECDKNKTQGRIKKWVEDTSKETIWMDELKDEHGRVALVTMKFELKHWLNGDMLNSFLINQTDYLDMFNLSIKTIKAIRELYIKNALDSDSYRLKNGKFNQQLALEVENIIAPVSDSTLLRSYGGIKLCLENGNLKLVDRSNNQQDLKTLLNNDKFNSFIKIFDFKLFKLLAKEAYTGCQGNKETFDDFIRQIFFGSVAGTHWEDWIKQSLLNLKINWHGEFIDWSRLTDQDINFLSTILLQFLLRKNPSPARLRRVWESTKEFFEEIERNICDYAGIPEERKKRYHWDNSGIPEGEYRDGDAIFWSDQKNVNKVYLISYLKDLPEAFRLKEYARRDSDEGKEHVRELQLRDGKRETYQPYMSITDPTPVSWQFIIPAEYVPNLIDNVIKKYNEHFRFVYGKLPLHIGVVIQDYKKPLYVGIKALRRIRRDIEDVEKLEINVKVSQIKDKLKCQRLEESLNDTQSYYSLYWGEHNKGYEFYVKPAGTQGYHRKWICPIGSIDDDKSVCIIPNTFDFEFLDTNSRRNDIRYARDSGYKRAVEMKRNRPYEIETFWEKFKVFRDVFGEDKYSTRLQKLVSMIYGKLDFKDDSLAIFMTSAFINTLEPKKDERILKMILQIFDIEESSVKSDGKLDTSKLYRQLMAKLNRESLKLFLDMFEFWHRTLKEV
ncbi:CRISPR-associated protein Csx11 [Caldicoprobacter faecalis]|uniref:CRISPR-associated protein, Csx11 family n=1 Tax=Caldicoprobacter faecalis TaxID=937334 RepID=A0A1I5WHN6_9FIRM|nr:CRISPR-associated protein Csx11 [Caldicoprobacter faecalis]SFQ19284.1 CRISPR-associated protein, Csx11 family [Caldicoprobacter faecalis]